MTQRTINLVTSQISHGVIDLSALENNPTTHEVLTGYRPSMIRLILLGEEDVKAIYNWYSTKPDKVFGLADDTGAAFDTDDSPLAVTERGFVLTLSDLVDGDEVIWEAFGSDPGESVEPVEPEPWSPPGDDDEYYGSGDDEYYGSGD